MKEHASPKPPGDKFFWLGTMNRFKKTESKGNVSNVGSYLIHCSSIHVKNSICFHMISGSISTSMANEVLYRDSLLKMS